MGTTIWKVRRNELVHLFGTPLTYNMGAPNAHCVRYTVIDRIPPRVLGRIPLAKLLRPLD